MKKDYIYQDKDGQYKLLQNATRIGGFVAGDGGTVPSERALPEQRFAHQPIFRRPPEEQVTVFSYIHNRLFSPSFSSIKVANLIRKSQTPAGVKLTYGYTGWENSPTRRGILLKNWGYEAQQSKTVHGNVCFPEDREWLIYWPGEGAVLNESMCPVFFRDYVWFRNTVFGDSILFSKLKNDKSETKDIRVAIRESNRQILQICCVYRDNDSYKMIVVKETVPLSPTFLSASVNFYVGGYEEGDYYHSDPPEPDILIGHYKYLTSVSVMLATLMDHIRGYMFSFSGGPPNEVSFSTGCVNSGIPSPANTIGGHVEPATMTGNENYAINFVEYTSNSLEGPWVVGKVWPNIYSIFWSVDDYYNNPAWVVMIAEIAGIISSKGHKDLSLLVGDYGGYVDEWDHVLQQVYDPPFNFDKWGPVWSRGNEGEIVTINDYESYSQNIFHTEHRYVVVWSNGVSELDRWEGDWTNSNVDTLSFPYPVIFELAVGPFVPLPDPPVIPGTTGFKEPTGKMLQGYMRGTMIFSSATYPFHSVLGAILSVEERTVSDGVIGRLRTVGGEKKYLVKRLGSGGMNKSLITEVIQK